MYNLPSIFLQLNLAWVLLVASFTAAQFVTGCQDYCGNISIPYPFGTSKECYVEEHFLLRLAKFPISYTRNKFTAVGCDSYAVISGSQGQKYDTGCLSLCDNINNVINGSCSGIGCCQTSIPKRVRSFYISVRSYDNHTLLWNFNPCTYAFVAEEAAYNFSSLDLANLQNRTMFPVVLDWSVGNQTCAEAKNNLTSFACKANGDYYDFHNGPGYRCNCSQGYEENPYLPNGCIGNHNCVESFQFLPNVDAMIYML
ncbi:wall-associated receptor kinase 2-like [Camellia sinensis]|uniref:wall-associated receptor kinase 2-like n=1 Tax=Camellia sinensis TaxID=4442 RepID=UPI0010367A01|nr:wall-associated receptor kinase 2-like [Camellia sinensis]